MEQKNLVKSRKVQRMKAPGSSVHWFHPRRLWKFSPPIGWHMPYPRDQGSDRIGFRFFPAGGPVFDRFGSFLDFSKSSVSAAFLTEPAVVHNHHSAAFVINFDRVSLYANKYTGASEFRALWKPNRKDF